VMMLRFAQTSRAYKNFRRKIVYPTQRGWM
jgi:hypothetical protein